MKRLIKVLKLLNKNEARLDHVLYGNWLFLTLIPCILKKEGRRKGERSRKTVFFQDPIETLLLYCLHISVNIQYIYIKDEWNSICLCNFLNNESILLRGSWLFYNRQFVVKTTVLLKIQQFLSKNTKSSVKNTNFFFQKYKNTTISVKNTTMLKIQYNCTATKR